MQLTLGLLRCSLTLRSINFYFAYQQHFQPTFIHQIMCGYFVLVFFCIITSCTNDKKEEFDAVQIAEQIWMKKNLDVITFRNGDTIPEAKSEEEWNKARHSLKPAWCHYKNNPDTDSTGTRTSLPSQMP